MIPNNKKTLECEIIKKEGSCINCAPSEKIKSFEEDEKRFAYIIPEGEKYVIIKNKDSYNIMPYEKGIEKLIKKYYPDYHIGTSNGDAIALIGNCPLICTVEYAKEHFKIVELK